MHPADVLLAGVVGLGAGLYAKHRKVSAPGPSYDAPPTTGQSNRSGPVLTKYVRTTPWYAIAPGNQTSQSMGTEWPFVPRSVVPTQTLLQAEEASWPIEGNWIQPGIKTSNRGGLTWQTLPQFANYLP